MLTIRLELLTEQYHATPWGTAANEGQIEWPPSPWRLSRALVSAWYRRPPHARAPEADVTELLRAIAGPPRFELPRATSAHSRHYMPLSWGKPVPGGHASGSPVIDAFVRTEPGGEVRVIWDEVTLTPHLRDLLGVLLADIGYLGRAESACTLGLLEPGRDLPPPVGAVPLRDDAGDGEVVRVLCAADDVTVGGLSQPTAERLRKGHFAPPAGTFVSYLRDVGALVPRTPRPRVRVPALPTWLRFALEGPSLPAAVSALRVAETLRRAVLARVDDADTESVGLLRGTGRDGAPMRDHQHCHYLPTDEDGDGRLDHISVWCPAGITAGMETAFDLVTLHGWRLVAPVHLVLLAKGSRSETNEATFARSRRWRSHTPFVPPRHTKRRGGRLIDSPTEQVARELAARGLPPADVTPLRDAGRRQWAGYARERDHVATPAGRSSALGFVLDFGEPVQGPISLGRLNHFGLGLFLPSP